MSVDAKKFKGLIEEIEASEKRSKSEAEHRAAIFKRAKGDGFNPKLMRVIVRERRRNEAERQKEQDELDTYRAALNAAVALVHNEGLSQREAARRSGVSKSSLNRALAVPAVSHDADGVITETADRKPPGDSSERVAEGSASGAAVATPSEPVDWDAINATQPTRLVGRAA